MPQTGEFHVEHSIAGPESSLVRYVLDIFESFKTARSPFEEAWEEAWLNYLGQYQDKTAWRSKTEGTGGRSRIFIKLTALKCNTAHAKIVDSLFANGELVPYGLVPLSTNGDPRDAAMAAEEWRKSVLDPHFSRIDLPEIISDATLELTILGTAVLKGPVLAPQRSRVVVDRGAGGVGIETGIEMVASVEHIPLWEYYVDTNAKTPAQSIGEIHFRRMLPQEFRDLAGGGGYDPAAVREAARRASNQDPSDTRYIQMADNYMGEHGVKDARVSSLEFWGLVPAAHLAEAGTLLPEGTEEEDSLEACVCLGADGIVTKAIVNPTGVRPFKVCPYKKRPHQAYGQGVAEAMRDSQKMINSIARLIIDNKALSGNGMVGVNLDRINVKRTKDLSVYPGKTWFIKGNYSPQEAIGTVGFQDVTLGLKDLLEQFERFADEETGIPKYSHGEQGSFLNKTAAGMSMLMAQANLNIKTAMRNIDNAWIEPLVEAFYDWFAGNGSGPRLPFKIKAAGTDSIIAKEIRLENLSKFITAAANPMFAPFVDQAKAIREMGRLLEIDLVRSEEEVAQILAQMQSQNGPGKSLKETVDIDRLYPYLTRAEQMQVLESLGIRPDPALPPGGPGAGGWNGDGNGDGQEHQGAGISPFGAPAGV